MTFLSLSKVVSAWFLATTLLLTTHILYGQNYDQFQLLDYETSETIIGANYKYGAQEGASDLNGFIHFQYTEGLVMEISHVSYGRWKLTDGEIKIALKNSVFYRHPKREQFQPVTIIALHQKRSETENLELGVRDKMAHDGGAVLNNIPAISSIRKSGGYGLDPVLRGFKYDQLNVVINGAQTSIAACPNRMDPPTSQMAPNMMERIEVLKGPHALRYGNGVGGTINFVPSKPDFSSQLKTYGRISAGNEFNGSIVRSEGLIGIRDQVYDLAIFASWSRGNDYEDGNGNSIDADFLRGSFGSNLGIKIGSGQNITLSVTRNVARDADFAALPMDLRKDDTWLFNASHEISFIDRPLQSWESTLFGTFVDHMMDNRLKDLNPRLLNAETVAETRTYGGRTEASFKASDWLIYAGADLRIEEAEGIRTRDFIAGPMAGKTAMDNVWQDGQIQKAGLFGEYQLFTADNTMKWVISARLELNSASAEDPASEFTELHTETKSTQINPAISWGGIKNFENDVSVGLWLGRTQRSGSLTERYINFFPVGMDPYEMIGNPDLDPEINNQLDLTLGYRTWNTRINIDLFASYLQDYISGKINPDVHPRMPISPGVRKFVNINEAFKTGFEIGWNQALWAGLQHQLNAAFTYGKDLELDEPLPEIAPFDLRYNLTGSYLQGRFSPGVTIRHVTRQDRVSIEFGETETPAFTLIDVSLDYNINRRISISAGANNLLNEAYWEHLSRSTSTHSTPIFAPGRNFYISFNLNFM